MQFWVSNPKTKPFFRSLDNQVIELGGLVFFLTVVSGLLLSAAAFGFLFIHLIILPILGVGVAAGFAIPEVYYKARLWSDKLRVIETSSYSNNKPVRVEWYEALYEIDNYECTLEEFLGNVSTDEYAFSSALQAYNTVRQELWDCTTQWKKIKPFLDRPKDSTQQLLKDELTLIKQRQESIKLIVDSVFDLSLRSASFTRAPKTHLDILARDLADLCTSMQELDEYCQNQLPAATVDISFRDSYGAQHRQQASLRSDA